MAEVVDVVMAPAADAQQQKRSFAADITNQGESQPKKPKKEKEPPKIYTLKWTAAERATKEAPSNAMVLSDVFRQPYAICTAIQETHAPKIKPTAAFVVHEGANILAAVEARKSGGAPSVPAGRLKRKPLWGGISSKQNAPASPVNIVGVDERLATYSQKGVELQARRGQSSKNGGKQKLKGVPCGAPFQVWRSDKEEQSASPLYYNVKDATKDCQRRWPNVAKKHPDYETTKMTNNMIMLLQGTNVHKISGCNKQSLRWARDNSKWSLAWKKQ